VLKKHFFTGDRETATHQTEAAQMDELSFTRNNREQAEVIAIAGRIDSSNVERFESVLAETMNSGTYCIVLDMREVQAISSAALRTLIKALQETRANNGDIRVAAPSKIVKDIFTLTGFDSMLMSYDDAESACLGFQDVTLGAN
jgi:anti-anti-sigma factor